MPRRSWSDPWNQFPESVPRRTTDGLSTSKQRGAMAGTWWSKRFVEVLESYGLGARMGRGRRYARSGQVISLDVRAGRLVAPVQGSRAKPYVVSIRTDRPSADQWATIDAALRTRIGFAAQLLAGELPSELEGVFVEAGARLLPSDWSQLDAECNCPDHENPCKHIAAVLYVFADRLDDDPWLLLAWQGRSRDEVLAPLRARVAGKAAGGRGSSAPVAPWWPFGPLESIPVGAPQSSPVDPPDAEIVTDPADPPDAVLARCEPLDVAVRGSEAATRLRAAYVALADRDLADRDL